MYNKLEEVLKNYIGNTLSKQSVDMMLPQHSEGKALHMASTKAHELHKDYSGLLKLVLQNVIAWTFQQYKAAV